MAAVRDDFEENFNLSAPTNKNNFFMNKKVQVQRDRNNNSIIKGNAGSRKSTPSNQNNGRVFDKVLQSPRKSIRRISREPALERIFMNQMLQ